jgi:hypothetical protein
MTRTRHLVVLADLQRAGAFGYQHIVHGTPSGREFLVFLGAGPHARSTRSGNLWVTYTASEASAEKVAVHRIGR